VEYFLELLSLSRLVENQLKFVLVNGVISQKKLLVGVPLLRRGEHRVDAYSKSTHELLEGVFDH
jgi:hypothetical protein